MKSVPTLLLIATTCATSYAAFAPSSFTGSASSVCSRAELTTELQCPPSASAFSKHRGHNMGMPPFLKKLGLKKPGSDDEQESTSNAVFTSKQQPQTTSNKNAAVTVDVDEEKELSETEKLLKQIKESGKAGFISYALWELGFWALSVPVCVFTYYQLVGHLPDFSNSDDLAKLGGEAFAFVNFARFAVPLRIGLALGTTPWVQENVVDKFFNDDKKEE